MVAVVEIQAVDVVVDGVEDDDLHAHLPQAVDLLGRHAHDAAEVVEDDLDLDARGGLAAEDIRQAVPDLPFGHDIVLEEDEALGVLGFVQQILQIRLARGEVRHARVLVEQKILHAEIVGELAPLGTAAAELLERRRAAPADDLVLIKRRLFLQVEPLLLAVAVPEKIEDQPRHRDSQNQQNPAELIARRSSGLHIDADGDGDGEQLEHRIRHGHALAQDHAEQHDQRNLRQQQHRHERQTQARGDPPLCFLLNFRLMHGKFLSFTGVGENGRGAA